MFSVERLALSSAISFLLALLFVVISSVLAIIALVQGKTKTPRLFPELNDGGLSFFSLFTASPVIVTAFTFHFNGNNQAPRTDLLLQIIHCSLLLVVEVKVFLKTLLQSIQ